MARITFTVGTKRYFIAQYAERGVSWTDAYYEIRPLVISQTRPWIFTSNPPKGSGGKRQPKPIGDQLIELKHEIRRVYAALDRAADDADVDTSAEDIPEATELPEEPEMPSEDSPDDRHFFFSEWKRIRAWIKQRADATGASPVDSLNSMRPVLEAKRGLAAGISAAAMLYAMSIHWSPETRAEAGIREINFIDEADRDLLDETHHAVTGYVVKLAEARIPIMLVGPSGTGKSGLMRKIASEILEVQFGDCPMSAGATPSWLLGRMTFPDGSEAKIEVPEAADMEDLTRLLVEAVSNLSDTTSYKISHFLKCFTEGGVFVFEEIDAADPNMLLVVNNALALRPGETFFNPINGKEYVKSPDFIPAASGNTYGLGADRNYTGRERLDFATIDRFRMGRVFVDLDEELAETLFFS